VNIRSRFIRAGEGQRNRVSATTCTPPGASSIPTGKCANVEYTYTITNTTATNIDCVDDQLGDRGTIPSLGSNEGATVKTSSGTTSVSTSTNFSQSTPGCVANPAVGFSSGRACQGFVRIDGGCESPAELWRRRGAVM